MDIASPGEVDVAELLAQSDAVVVARIEGSRGIQEGFSFEGVDDFEAPDSERYAIVVERSLKGAWAGTMIYLVPGTFHGGERCLLFQARVGGYDAYELLCAVDLRADGAADLLERAGRALGLA